MLNVDDNHVFLLLVDEAQRAQKTSGKNVNEIVTSLHTGGDFTAGLRILPVFAGLSDTSEQLINAGLSRQAVKPHRLGALTLDQAQYAAEGFMRDQTMGLDQAFTQNDRSQLARTFAVASEGWPRHLHHYLTGSAQEIVDDCENPNPAGVVSLPAILEHGHEARFDYYIDRLQGSRIREVGDALKMLTQELDPVIGTLNRDDIEQFVADHYTNKQVDVDDQIDQAIHAGVLEPRPECGVGYFGYPIPSFSTFMACRGEREPTLENMRASFQACLQDVIAKSSTGRSTRLTRD